MRTAPPRPRIVIASRLYEPEVTAAAFRVAALARALASAADVEVVTTIAPSGTSAGSLDDSIRVSRGWVLRNAAGAVRGYASYASFDLPLFFRLLARRPDVVVAEAPPTTGLVALAAARLRRARFVYYPGDIWTDGVIAMGASAGVVFAMRRIESRVLASADRVLAVSPEVALRVRQMGAHADRVVEVGNGVDTAVFRPDVAPPETPRPYFVYTGTMSEWQQPEIFIRALGGVDADIRFFGQGSAEADLRRIAEEVAPGRVHFGGVVPPAESARWIRGSIAALVSIVPGIGYDFARPTKTYAAAACGTPVLYAGAATGAEIVREAGLGEAVAFDVMHVASAMRSLIGQRIDGTTERLRAHRAGWAEQNVSLSAAGSRAAIAVQGCAPRGR